MKRYLFFIALCACASAYPYGGNRQEYTNGPWFTGPLIAPAAYTVPLGHVNLEPYLYVNSAIGTYQGNWKANSQGKSTSIILQVPAQIGLSSFMDLLLLPSGSHTIVKGHKAYGFNDLLTAVNFQIWRENPGSLLPAIKFFIREVFPTGKYQNLNPKKRGADASGEGAYVTTVGFSFAKLYSFEGYNYFRIRSSFGYSISSAVDIEGFNVYGGTLPFKGKAYPGNELAWVIGLEYTPTLHLAFALDILAITAKKTRLKGHSEIMAPQLAAIAQLGTIPNEQLLPGGDVSVGNRSSEQISIAPAIEYNFSQNIGIITGVWFTVLGRNTPRYINGVVSINMYF